MIAGPHLAAGTDIGETGAQECPRDKGDGLKRIGRSTAMRVQRVDPFADEDGGRKIPVTQVHRRADPFVAIVYIQRVAEQQRYFVSRPIGSAGIPETVEFLVQAEVQRVLAKPGPEGLLYGASVAPETDAKRRCPDIAAQHIAQHGREE